MHNHIITLLLCLVLSTFSAQAQESKISRAYIRKPMSEALRDISQSSKGKQIMFVYDQLEDYTVTCTFQNLTPIEAIYRIVGLYPIRVSQTPESIAVEPLYDASKKLIGRLVNEHGAPVEFASVRLYNLVDSTFITGGASNENGDFVIPTDANNVRMEISCLGYVPQSHNVTVGYIGSFTVYTNPTLLKSITVTADDIKYVNDHIEARPTKTQVEHSFNIFYMLNMQPFPGLEVDEVNRVLKAFNSNLIILVNGIERSVEYLNTIQPKNVAKINYYTTIPAKYAARGAGAVLDIILKEPNEGGSFYAEGRGAVNTKFYDWRTGATYNQGKSEFALQYIGSYRSYHKSYDTFETSYIGDDFRVDRNLSDGKAPLHYNSHQLKTDYTLRPDKSSAFVASASLISYSGYNYLYGTLYDSQKGSSKLYNRIHQKHLKPEFSLYYQKNWEGGKQLDIFATGTHSPEEYERKYTQTLETGEILEFPSDVKTKFTSISAGAFYQQPLNNKTSIAFRAGNSYANTRSDYALLDFFAENKNFKFYADAALNSRIGKARMQTRAGLNLQSISNDAQEWTKPFINATINFGIPFGKGFDFNASADLAPIVPSLSSYIENEQVVDNYLWLTGNPDLKTGYYLSMQQRLWWSHKNFWLNASVSEIKGYNPIYTDIRYLGNKQFLQRYENAQATWQITPSLAFGVRELFNKHFTARVDLAYNYYYARLCDGEVNDYTSLYAMLNLYGYFGKWTLSFGIKKPIKALQYNTIVQGENNNNFSVSYKLNNKIHFSASLHYFLDGKGTYYPREYISDAYKGTSVRHIKDNHMMACISFRYDINFGRLFNRPKINYNISTGKSDVQLVQ